MLRMSRLSIVTAALIVALLAFAVGALVLLGRQEPPAFPEDTPAGVVQRFLWAIQEGDLQRAFTYLTPEEPPPPSGSRRPRSYEEFRRSFSARSEGSSVHVVLERETVNDDGTAEVRVVFSFVESSDLPFGNPVRQQRDEFQLRLENGAWRIAIYPWPVYQLYRQGRPR